MGCFGKLCVALVLGWLNAGLAVANEAQMIFHCSSVSLRPAQTAVLGQTYGLAVTTLTDGTINDEIGLSDNPDSSHFRATDLVYTDPTYAGALVIPCDLDIADPGDHSVNGVSDFFEVDHAVNAATSSGEFILAQGTNTYPGTVDMVWDRLTGSTTGTCSLRMQIPALGVDLTFHHQFEFYEYAGTLSYQVVGTNILSTVALTRQGTSGSLSGPLKLHRLDANELSFDAAIWTKESGAHIHWLSSTAMNLDLFRGGMGTNYWGMLGTLYGMPETPRIGEYQVWEIYIFDANDSNHNGIADVSDVPAPQPPSLAVRWAGKQLKLQIASEIGRRLVVEQATALPATNWTALPAITLTNAVQEIDLAAPAESPAFWRAWVE